MLCIKKGQRIWSSQEQTKRREWGTEMERKEDKDGMSCPFLWHPSLASGKPAKLSVPGVLGFQGNQQRVYYRVLLGKKSMVCADTRGQGTTSANSLGKEQTSLRKSWGFTGWSSEAQGSPS